MRSDFTTRSFRKERKTVMKRSLKTWLPKLGATVLSVALGASVLPVLTGNRLRADEEWSKNKDNTGLGTSIIKNPTKPTDKDDPWRGDYVYFGTYEGEPILFRVLDNETEVYGGKTMLLDSDRALFMEEFDYYVDGDDDWAEYYYESMWEFMGPLWDEDLPQARDGDEDDEDDEDDYNDEDIDYPYYPWAQCDLRDGLNGVDFLNKDGVFTGGEKNAIFTSVFNGGTDVRIDEDSDILLDLFDGKTTSLNDKIFVLDVDDVLNPEYGYSSFAGLVPLEEPDEYGYFSGDSVYNRAKLNLDGYESTWWLRNTIEPCESTSPLYEGFINPETVLATATNGQIDPRVVFEEGIEVAPALNVDLSKVLFSSVVYEESDDIGAIHKLTVIDDDLKIALTEGEKIAVEGSKITVSYTITGDATQASVLILDKAFEAGKTDDTNIIFYGAMEGDGKGSFELPSDLDVSKWGEEFFVYIIAEEINDKEETDYASAPVEIAAPEKKDNDNKDSDDGNKTEYTITVTSAGNGTAKASVTKAVEGTEITLTATPDEGYKFKSYEVVSGGITITDNKFKVGKENVEIKVNFEASASNNNNSNNNNNNNGNTNTTTPTPKPKSEVTYTVIQGADAKWKIGTTTSLPMVKIQRSEDDENILKYFSGVSVNGRSLMKDTDYTVKDGCIEVTLTDSYVKKLSAGTYTIKVDFVDGSVTATLTIQAADKAAATTTSSNSSVKTGETLMYATYGIALLVAASVSVTASYVVRKKRKTE